MKTHRGSKTEKKEINEAIIFRSFAACNRADGARHLSSFSLACAGKKHTEGEKKRMQQAQQFRARRSNVYSREKNEELYEQKKKKFHRYMAIFEIITLDVLELYIDKSTFCYFSPRAHWP